MLDRVLSKQAIKEVYFLLMYSVTVILFTHVVVTGNIIANLTL